jgi:hypothetical protein
MEFDGWSLAEESRHIQRDHKRRIRAICNLSNLDPTRNTANDCGHLQRAAIRMETMNQWKQLFLAAAMMAIPPCLPGQPGAPIVLSISVPTTTRAGEEVRLEIMVTNTSDQTVEIYTASGRPDGGEAEDYNGIDVRDADRKLLPRTGGHQFERSDGTVVLHRSTLSLRPAALAPGERFHDYTTLSRLFDLTKPGTYVVTVRQDVRLDHAVPEPKRVTATSNTITVTVLPADQSASGPDL